MLIFALMTWGSSELIERMVRKSSRRKKGDQKGEATHPEGGAASARLIDIASVREHTSRADCWLAIEGGVYNVSEFLSEHPGGETVLLQRAGGDATRAFRDAKHSARVRDEMLPRLMVGRLAPPVAEGMQR